MARDIGVPAPTQQNFFFENGDFLILYVSWHEYSKNLIKKIYPTGHVKKKKKLDIFQL